MASQGCFNQLDCLFTSIISSNSTPTHLIPSLIICDRICKKGSYTRTTSTYRFHHHSIDTLSDNPCVHVLWPTVHQSALPEAAF